MVSGWLVLLIGLNNVLGGIAPRWHHRWLEFSEVLPGTVTDVAWVFVVFTGLLLLMLARALRRRKRRAWQAVVVLLTISTVLHLVKDLSLVEASVSATMLAVLVWYRGEFFAVGDPRTRWRALYAGVLLTIGGFAIGLLFLEVNSRELVGGHDLTSRIQAIGLGMVGLNGPVRFASERWQDMFGFALGAFGFFTAVTVVYLFLRPAAAVATLTDEDEARIRALLERHGRRDSLGYFALRRDKSVLWSPTGKACVTYRVVSGVILASGDPIGDPEAWPGAIRTFLSEADRHAWIPSVMGCGERAAEMWVREGGLDALEIGDEAIVDVADFDLQGRAMRNVRQMAHRVSRRGYTVEVRRERDYAPGELAALWAKAVAWRGTGTERGFSMALSRIGGHGDGDCVVVVASRAGEPAALLHFVPWGRDGLSLDLMRRDRSAQAGLNEFMIVEMVRRAPELGINRISLNFAAFRAVFERGERVGAGPILRIWRRMLLFLSSWFQMESLYRFNAKFQPAWQPRFLVYPTLRDLLRILPALLKAEALLVLPHLHLPRFSLPHRSRRRLPPGTDRDDGTRAEIDQPHRSRRRLPPGT